MKNKIAIFVVFSIFAVVFFSCNNNQKKQKPKYVFLLIGDGMGVNHAYITNQYLIEKGEEELLFTSFPNIALTNTNCLDTAKITDSGAAGTAIATGKKTNYRVIGMDTLNNQKYNSFAYFAKQNGWKTGILSSVGINHATPAAFYGHQKSRSMYNELALEMINPYIDFYAGGGLLRKDGQTMKSLIDTLKNNDFAFYNNIDKVDNADYKQIYITDTNEYAGSKSLPYSIDNKGEKTIADYTKMAIEMLDNENGFFIMVEGGKIDWASHGNDGATVIKETIDFNEAVKIAYDFYEKHPEETLIIVTADHETGGISLGRIETKYDTYLYNIDKQKASYDIVLDSLKNSDSSLYSKIAKSFFGFEIEDVSVSSPEKFAYQLIDSINKISGIGWTTYSHTGSKVATYAIGAGSENYQGYIDNTDIVNKLLQLLEWKDIHISEPKNTESTNE